MSLSVSIQPSPKSFTAFLVGEKTNRVYLWVALAGIPVQLIVFKLLYPFADFFSDSYSYLYGAYANLDVNIWPIGYSKFLRLFHSITHSDTALVAFQYIFLQLSGLYFYFTVLHVLQPGKVQRLVLFLFLFFNPLFLYISNYVNSDPLFAALSFLWFTQLIRIMTKPRPAQLVVHALLLFACFTVRNNAYYYPVISVIAYLLSRQSAPRKAAGILAPALLIIPFILHTRNEAFKLTGTKQFSLFTGWQLASNALYMYEYAGIDSSAFPTEASRELNRYSIFFYSRTQKDFRENYLKGYVGNFFIREPLSPLKTYYSTHYPVKDDSGQVVAWGKASAVFNDYAATIIKQNPGAYFWEFMVVNMRHYILPPLEKLEVYNLGEDHVDPLAVHWFHYKSPKVSSVSPTAQGNVLMALPPMFFFLNAFVLGCVIVLLFQGRVKGISRNALMVGVLGLAFVLANFAFLVSTTIIVFRYQVFPMVILLLLGCLLTEHMNGEPLPAKNTIQYA